MSIENLVIGLIIGLVGVALGYIIKQKVQGTDAQQEKKKAEHLEQQLQSEKEKQRAMEQEYQKIAAQYKELEQKNRQERNSTFDMDNLKGKASKIQQENDSLKRELKEYKEALEKECSADISKDYLERLQTQINEYKKRVEAFDDELDDAKFDLEKSEKKNKETEEKLSGLMQRYEVLEKEAHHSQQELDQKSKILEHTQSDLDKKKQAVELINAFLAAPLVDIDKSNTDKAVSDIKSFVEDRLLVALRGYDEINDTELKAYRNSIWNWANLQRKQWIVGKRTVAFVGEFSAGKTSIVNKILLQADPNSRLLPVSSKATTAIPTYISYAPLQKVEFTSPNGDLHKVEESLLTKITKETLEEIRVSSLIQYFVNSYENQNLKGLSVLDTSGFNSNDPEDKKRTSEVIRETDVLFWVMDVNAGGINTSSLQIIKEELQGHPLFIIINKADTKSPSEVEQAKKHIAKTLKDNGITAEGYIEFSQKHDTKELMHAIFSVPTNANKADEYLDEIYSKLLEEIAEADQDYKNFQRGQGKLESSIDGVQSSLRSAFNDINYLTNKIVSLGSKNSSFGEFFYGKEIHLKEAEHNSLKNACSSIESSVSKINRNVQTLQQDVRGLQAEQNKREAAQRQRNELERLKEEFDRLIRRWNKDYLKRVITKGSPSKEQAQPSSSTKNNAYVEQPQSFLSFLFGEQKGEPKLYNMPPELPAAEGILPKNKPASQNTIDAIQKIQQHNASTMKEIRKMEERKKKR